MAQDVKRSPLPSDEGHDPRMALSHKDIDPCNPTAWADPEKKVMQPYAVEQNGGVKL